MVAPEPLLLDGEYVLWEGTPYGGMRLYEQDRMLIPFAFLWGGFALYWNVIVWVYGRSWYLRLWGIPFLLAGLYLLAGRFFVDAWVRRRQSYFVTNRRVIVLHTGWRNRLRSVDIDWLPFVKITENSDGSGDMRFGPTRWGTTPKTRQRYDRDQWIPALSPTVQFLGIPQVAQVHDLIRRAGQR